MRIVIAGGGLAGLYAAYRTHKAAPDVEVVLIDGRPHHEFVMGAPLAIRGLVGFGDLKFPLTRLSAVKFVEGHVAGVEGNCVRLEGGGEVCGDYVLLAPGSYRGEAAGFWTLDGVERTYKLASSARAIRFIINDVYPVKGFQDVARALKRRFPGLEVSIHVVSMTDDIKAFLKPYIDHAAKVGIYVTDEPPPPIRPGEVHIPVPSARPHPLIVKLDPDPATFETRFEGVYAVGEAALAAVGMPPSGMLSLKQTGKVVDMVLEGALKGYVEAEPLGDLDDFGIYYKYLACTPVKELFDFYELWRNSVITTLA
ncbi:MAG: NAD(P)/FAD-dependent oxidoreductase [Thermoproteus sp.]